MQQLFIQNFGPITEAEVQVEDFTVFIGPQASGKSTIAKTIYLFKSLKEDVTKHIIGAIEGSNSLDKPSIFKKKIGAKFVSFWGSTKYFTQFRLEYTYAKQKTIKLSLDKGYIKATFSKIFEAELANIFLEATRFFEKNQNNPSFLAPSAIISIESEKKAFYKRVEQLADVLFEDERLALYIPAGRSLLSTLSDPLQKILLTRIVGQEKNGTFDAYLLDYPLKTFIERINNSKSDYHQDFETIIKDRMAYSNDPIDHENLQAALEIFDKILKGRYRFDKDGEKIVLPDTEQLIKLAFASSGQQEVVWILLQIFALILNATKVFMVIEEPEAHLFPVAQKDIVELICLLSNLNNNQIMLTTHSPYILSSLNNFIYAGKLGKTKPTAVAKFIPKKSWIQPEKIAAFYIEQGKMTNIMDEELQLIRAEEIDKASSIINEQFNHLFELDLE